MTDKQDTQAITFEDAYKQLSEVIDQLESGQLSLDESMTLYERGRSLIALCDKLLNTAELRISQLSKDHDGAYHLEPLT